MYYLKSTLFSVYPDGLEILTIILILLDRHYMFSIKKCKDVQCKFHLPPMLPDELFDSLHHLPDPIPSGERYTIYILVVYM